MRILNIAVLSGKGGTGKTTISTNLALALKADYIDCDVEEPNGFLFLKPTDVSCRNVEIEFPFIDDDLCTYCGRCAEVCQFNALAMVNEDISLFPKLCHSCGACSIVCKEEAISYKNRTIGSIETGICGDIKCSRGKLNVGEPMAVPVIKQLLDGISECSNIIDCAPGTSCNVITILKYTDAAILVTEPSEFGLHDLKLAVETVRMFNIPYGVFINKDDGKDNIIRRYLKSENIDCLGELPYDRKTAEIYSKGKSLYDVQDYKIIFDEFSGRIKEAFKWN